MNRSVTCFLVDDDADDQEIFESALKEIDPAIRCIMANDGTEALLKLNSDKTFAPDFIFLDLNMPGINGKQCLAEIKKDSRFKTTPVIIYSTTVSERDMEEINHLGAMTFFTKPSRFSELCTTLSGILGQKVTVTKKL